MERIVSRNFQLEFSLEGSLNDGLETQSSAFSIQFYISITRIFSVYDKVVKSNITLSWYAFYEYVQLIITYPRSFRTDSLYYHFICTTIPINHSVSCSVTEPVSGHFITQP